MHSSVVAFLFIFYCFSEAQVPVENCPQIPPHTPKDINDVAPSNIDVIMALGDSITAGFGAMGREGLLDEYRGIPGAIGGDEGQWTLSNFIKHYNPNIVGHSYGYHLIEVAGEESHYYNDVLNAAQSGATTADFKDQVNYLISQLATPTFANVTSSYKLLTILIGANDVCDFCKETNRPTPQVAADQYEANIRDAIQTVYKNIPNTIVNLIPLFNISGVYNLTIGLSYCTDLHDILPMECKCLFKGSDEDRLYIDETLVEFGKRLIEISNDWKSQNLTDFAVVFQPFTIGMKLVECGIEFLSDLDCFHPSLLAHRKMTVAGWNSMIVPLAQKKWYFDPTDPFQCLDADSRIFTN